MALALTALLFLSPLGFTVSAQQSSDSKVPQGDYFVFYQGANGDVVCREATLFERREMAKPDPDGLGLHQINHLNRGYEDKAHGASVQGGDNVLPSHLTIILRATAQLDEPANAQAKAAFIRAAQIWEAQVLSPVTIYIDVDYGTTNFGVPWSAGVLGSTSSPSLSNVPYSSLRSNLLASASNATETTMYNSLPSTVVPTDLGDVSTVSVSSSIARAVGLLDPTAQPTDSSARIGFNGNFTYDFDPSDGISGGTDFEAVAVHEIGHALGFTSRSGSGSGAQPVTPAVWDLFRFRTGATASTFTTAPRIMTKGPGVAGVNDQFYFAPGYPGELSLSTGGNNPPSGQTDGDGNQSSHWKQRTQNLNQTYIGIMDPRIPANTRRQITVNDTNALNTFGYSLENANPPPPPPPPPPAPANDLFANPQTIAGCTGSVAGTNISATKDASEPSHSPDNNVGGGSVWYQWTAPVSGSTTLTTLGSNYDTLLAAYTGTAVNNLTLIERNDDVSTSGGILTSSITFNAVAGTNYKIAVDGWGGETGSIVLNWTEAGCSQATTVQLSASSFSIGEGGGHVAIDVTRSNTTAAASVDFATSDTFPIASNCQSASNGVASSRCDYATTLGTLNFAVGDATETIIVPIVDDNISDGNEAFTITLSNPTGASLGTSTAPVTINENANGAGNPVDSDPFFVNQHYIDLLGRLPDQGGYNAWLGILSGCGTTVAPPCDKIEVSSAFFRSEEFQSRGYFVYRLYSTVGTIPGYDTFMPDFARVSGFLSEQQKEANKVALVNDFTTRPAFTNLYGGLTAPNNYVDGLLQTVGFPNHPQRNAWISALQSGSLNRAQVFRQVAETVEVYNKYYTEAFVIMQYFGYLRRSADASYVFWIDTMNQNNQDYRIMVNGFLNSVEYRQRFGP